MKTQVLPSERARRSLRLPALGSRTSPSADSAPVGDGAASRPPAHRPMSAPKGLRRPSYAILRPEMPETRGSAESIDRLPRIHGTIAFLLGTRTRLRIRHKDGPPFADHVPNEFGSISVSRPHTHRSLRNRRISLADGDPIAVNPTGKSQQKPHGQTRSPMYLHTHDSGKHTPVVKPQSCTLHVFRKMMNSYQG